MKYVTKQCTLLYTLSLCGSIKVFLFHKIRIINSLSIMRENILIATASQHRNDKLHMISFCFHFKAY